LEESITDDSRVDDEDLLCSFSSSSSFSSIVTLESRESAKNPKFPTHSISSLSEEVPFESCCGIIAPKANSSFCSE
uniref:Ovule protein n=1 Tax=Hymenolepis diminuta TaxID=6216 RepID=A0A158QBN3_HYMDI